MQHVHSVLQRPTACTFLEISTNKWSKGDQERSMVVLSLRHINILKIRVLTPFREPPYLKADLGLLEAGMGLSETGSGILMTGSGRPRAGSGL